LVTAAETRAHVLMSRRGELPVVGPLREQPCSVVGCVVRCALCVVRGARRKAA
jgi:hypothetical protein